MTWNRAVPIVLIALAMVGAGNAGLAAESKTVVIAVTAKGFEPNTVTVKKGQPVEIVFIRKTNKACTREVALETGDAEKTQRSLPLNKRVTIATTFTKARDYKYACDMNTFSGTVIVQ